MKKSVKAALAVTLSAVVLCAALGWWQFSQTDFQERQVHHELAQEADPSIGDAEIPEDFIVGDDFTSHLPLVVIDTAGQEIVNYKYYDAEIDAFVEPADVDPYTRMTVSVIDNGSHVNRLGDAPAVQSSGKLKIRGNTSASSRYPKKQYRIKLLTETGEKNSVGLMGMTASDDWILNGTPLDRSHLRNYLAMNIGGMVFPETPDMRYCEAVLKTDAGYEYLGLYILYEAVERGEGRVELSRYDESQVQCDFLLRRDRYETEGIILDTYATREGLTEEYLEVQYPPQDRITPETVSWITEQINQIERLLYSENVPDMAEVERYLNVDTFVDYFIINEFFMNYDAGLHSTYLHQQIGGTLEIGPLWDFDGAMDNYDKELGMFYETTMEVRSYLDALLKVPGFAERVESRYHELRKTVLSQEYLESFIDQTQAFLGNAAARDASRWDAVFAAALPELEEEETGLTVDRTVSSSQEESQRIKDVLALHGEYLDENIQSLERYTDTWIYGGQNANFLSILFILAFFISIVLIQRARKN